MRVFCSALIASRSFRFFVRFLFILSSFLQLGWVLRNALKIPLCFIFCLLSFLVLLVRYFTTLTLMDRVLLFEIAFFPYFVLFFSFGTVCPFRRGIFNIIK